MIRIKLHRISHAFAYLLSSLKQVFYINSRFRIMNKALFATLVLSLSLGLTACGGSSNSNSSNNGNGDTGGDNNGSGQAAKTVAFADTPIEFTADLESAEHVCYDVELKSAVDCDSNADTWDVRFDKAGFNIWLNGGIYGEGDAGAFGPNTLAEMKKYEGGAKVPGYFKDQVSGVFLDSSWYAYSLNGQHKLWPNYRVYSIETNSKHYKVRLLSYYAPLDSTEPAAGTSGVITFEYEEITDGVTGSSVTKTIDASAGGFGAKADDPKNKYTYFNFATDSVIELTDEEAAASDAWDIAFKRTSIQLNSNNAPATKAALAAAQDDFYDANGDALKATFLAATKATEQAEYDAVDSTTVAGLTHVADSNKHVLDGKWYNYAGAPTHAFDANPDNHWIIRNAEGDGYYIFNVKALTRANRTFTSFTVNFYPEETK